MVTHRGIDIELGEDPRGTAMESTRQAFECQIAKGFGLEFDLQQMADDQFLVTHDSDLRRFSEGRIKTSIKDLKATDIEAVSSGERSLMGLESLLDLIAAKGQALSAMHLKSHVQNQKSLDVIIPLLKERQEGLKDRLLLFDVRPDIAAVLKRRLPLLQLAASIVHPFDQARYNKVTGNTLITMDEFFSVSDRYDWAWMDEWDLQDKNGKTKSLINAENITRLKAAGFGVAVVSPELHATSPGLLGGEAHEVGKDSTRLKEWWIQCFPLGIDLLCSDHCSWVNENLKKRTK